MRTIGVLTLLLAASACASAPPALPPAPPGPSFAQKQAWILRLEDERVLRDPPPPPPVEAPAPPQPSGRKRQVVAPPPPPPPTPDLVRLLGDNEARIRRRAALAIGRVGLREGVTPLQDLLSDSEAEVRQMAAFALGLIGDASAQPALITALTDASPMVRGSAAQALGLLGDAAAATPIARMAQQILDAGALAEPPSESDEVSRDSAVDAFQQALFALVRLKAFDPLASVVLDATGQPRVRWWPVAYALQRLEDRRAVPALLTLAGDPHPYTRAFAVKGLGALKEKSAVPVLLPLVGGGDRFVTVEAVRALGRIGDPAATPLFLKILQAPKGDPVLRAEVTAALAGTGDAASLDVLLDMLGDSVPGVRAAAIRGLSERDPDNFVTVLSALDPDPQWSVRAALASALGGLPPEAALPRLRMLLDDGDQRAIPSALASLVRLRPPDAGEILLARLKADDPIVRAAAAAGLGELKPTAGVAALAEAYRFGQRDLVYQARTAALEALAKYGGPEATAVLQEALADKDWAARVRAATLLTGLDPAADVDKIRPVPTSHPVEFYQTPQLIEPSISTHVFIETDRGNIELELAVLDAPLTVDSFITLARKQFFDGLTFHRVVSNFVIQGGDPRGDSEGGPGFTIRDELNQRAYVRGTVGMALDWQDTGGSQFFITQSPQPQLDARYTVFGRVVSGMDIVDQIQPWDVIRRVRVWDGVNGTQD